MSDLQGVLPITLTPFTDDGDVDEASIDSLVEDYLGAGAHGLTILGIMGEAAKLLDDERERVLRRYVGATAGRVPVVAGVSARATHMSLDYARRAEDAGAAAVMLAPPDNTKNLDLVFEHFRRVAEAVSVPVVVQDEPVNTGVTMPAPFLVRLLDEIEGCRYLKLEETPTLPKITAVRQKATSPGGDLRRPRRALPVRGAAARCRRDHDRLRLPAGAGAAPTSGSSPATARTRRSTSSATCR